MLKHSLTMISCLALTLLSLQTFAAGKRISVSVQTAERSAAGIGFSVNGRNTGGAGRSFTGKGPQNSRYLFGFRQNSVSGKNVACGSLTLNKNSRVTLVYKGGRCRSVLN
ncbi:MAG: hypothetical protein P4L65_03465 [Legionella sp.]|nr:hypothetical protein [Legionella sp.]